VVDGGTWLSQWFKLRFAQRQMLMCSMGLSGRLLTLTGRMSMFRARFALDPSFIESLAPTASITGGSAAFRS
jgi:mannuronan synthase